MPLKRSQSPCDRNDKSPKRRAIEPINVDDDDLETLLIQIKQQEESEALARRLQEEWNNDLNPGQSSRDHRGGPHSPITIEDEESSVIVDDETLARRLADEWAREDNTVAENPIPGPSSSRPTEDHAQSRTSSKEKVKTPPPDATPDVVLEDFRGFFVGSRNCSKCDHEILSPRGFVTYSTQVPPPSLLALLHVPCPDCETIFCRGCSRVLPCPTSCREKGKDKSPVCPVWTCCAEVRAIALFEALGGFDRHYIGERTTSASRSKEAMQKYRSSGEGSVGPGGTGYGTGLGGYGPGDYEYGYIHGRGRGRGGRGRGGYQNVESGPSRLMELVAHADVIIVRALQTITQLLPAPYTDSPHDYDMIPHTTTATLILASYLPELLASLLRNDSVTDWTSRSDVYNAMLGLLRRMSDCELTLEVIISERYEMERSGGLEEWMWGDADISWTKSEDKIVKLNPLYSHFQKLTKQCEAFLSGASQMLESGEEPPEDVESIIKSTSLCGEIIAARDDLERAMKAMGRDPAALSRPQQQNGGLSVTTANGSKKDDTDQSPDQALVKRYSSECERLAFHHVPFPQENGNYSTFNFANLVNKTASSTRNPKDRLHLIKELAVMATSLPPGVWVRVDEVRNDVLKIMIAGPEGTPYAGGLFEFDCFLPLEYPHKPPLMHLRTTGGGSVRFNPNLYNNGKVCLSLLGTWPGRPEEQWSSKSTLLQVLVSIQSMILIDLPYFNEPGFGKANLTHPASVSYNRNIAVQTVRWAMIEWLKDENKTSMWADVIKTHFTLLSSKIFSSIEKWAAEEPRMKAYTPNAPGMRHNIPPPGLFGPSSTPPMLTGHIPHNVAAINHINTMSGAMMSSGSQGVMNPYVMNGNDHANVGGMNLLEEFQKGVKRVEGCEEGTYTSP